MDLAILIIRRGVGICPDASVRKSLLKIPGIPVGWSGRG